VITYIIIFWFFEYIFTNLCFEFHDLKQSTFTRKSPFIYHYLYIHDGSNAVINRYPSKYLTHYIRILCYSYSSYNMVNKIYLSLLVVRLAIYIVCTCYTVYNTAAAVSENARKPSIKCNVYSTCKSFIYLKQRIFLKLYSGFSKTICYMKLFFNFRIQFESRF